MSVLLRVLLFSLLPATLLLAGGALALWRAPHQAWRSAVLHFAAGVVFSVVAVELLPDIVKTHRPLEVALGFGGGVAAMLGVRHLTEAGKEGEPKSAPNAGLPLGLLAGVGVDVLLDGLLLGIGFAAGQKEGVLLALALAVELLSLGVATSLELNRAGASRTRALGALGGLSLLFVGGAALGGSLLQGLRAEWLELVLSFGLAALLFLVTEELLVEAHEDAETPLLTAAFFGGFLLFLLLGMSG